ncbi:hypothetical protein MYX07_00860 [Patescibacteria group bacterium AH-259-L07]|nr:hypothetical protein [Patescibacteria group bacterium AH-259-L07]
MLKDGTELHFDFRSYWISLFILKQGQDKHILATGSSRNSGERTAYQIFTATFYLLGEKQAIPHHLVRHDSFNTYHYIATYKKPIITLLGLHNSMGNLEEIEKNSIWLDHALKKIP